MHAHITTTRETGGNIGRRTKNTPNNSYTLSSCISQEGQMAILTTTCADTRRH